MHIKWDDEDLIPSQGDFLFVLIDQKGVPFRINKINITGELVDLERIDSEEKVQELIGKEVGLDQSQIPEDYSGTAIDGFTLKAPNANFEGIISSVQEYPGQLMLNVICNNSEYLIPFIQDWIRETDINARTLIMDLPEGLITSDSDLEYED